MPPKKKAGETKKTEQKKQAKVIEDKTFGLKNKKGAKQQQFVKQVEKQVKFGAQPARKLPEADPATKKKEEKKKQQEELNALFRPVTKQQKVEKGADPKSVVCAFFKQGLCGKGDRCKFSHDLSLERKGEKRSAYVDVREDEETMNDWDEAKLEEVIQKKHGEKEKTKPKTDIICKFFVQALEDCKYGWFWQCPNGDNCHYRHALPPGFVLKKDKKKMEEQNEEISMEELIESERSKLSVSATLVKITLDTFVAWKKRKRQERIEKADKESEKKKAEFQAGRLVGLSGRDMFTFRPEMAIDDDDEADEGITYTRETEDDDEYSGPVVEVDLSTLSALAREVDPSAADHLTVSNSNVRRGHTHATLDDESSKLDMACGGGGGDDIDTSAGDTRNGAASTGVEINEDLFTDDVDVDEDLFASEADVIDVTEMDGAMNSLHLNNNVDNSLDHQ